MQIEDLLGRCGLGAMLHGSLTRHRQLMYTHNMESPSARHWDWISAGLLFLLLQMPAARLVTTDWAPFLYWTETMAGRGHDPGPGPGCKPLQEPDGDFCWA